MAIRKVSNQINHINKRNSVLVVTGKQTAKIYELRRGRILQDPSITIANPKYSDREGFQMRRGRGSVWGTPSAYESKDNGAETDFLHSLEKQTTGLTRSKEFDAVYLFAPAECVRRIKKALPAGWLERLEFEYHGNFTKISPTGLLKKITDSMEQDKHNREVELKGDARKILRRKRVKQSEK